MSSFNNLRIVDNFYQTSLFYPMPTMLIGTLAPDGSTSLGAYSLCFPYYIAGKSYYAMLLECRNSSNTAQNILRTGVCSINFLDDSKRLFKETVRLGFPGEACVEKMEDCFLKMEEGQAFAADPEKKPRPLVLKDAFQVMECTWDDSLEAAYEDRTRVGQVDGIEPPYKNFNGITSKFGAHFILKIDAILMKERQYNAIVHGVRAKDFPRIPVDYGYRDSKNFWYTQFKTPISMPVPAKPEMDFSSVKYAADRIDPEVCFSDEACAKLRKIPRVFLNTALTSIAEQSKTMGLPRVDGKIIIDEKILEIVNDKRKNEKQQ